MDERLVQFRVGVMVLATAIITIILILLFGEFPSLARNNYTVTMFFEEAPGVMKDTPVRKNGLLIGRVTEVELDEQRRGVVITATIDGARRLYKNEIPRISGSLLGDATIEFMLGRNVRPEAQHELITSADTLVGEVAPSPMDAFSDLQRRLDDAFVILEQTSRNIDETSATIRETAKTFTTAGNQFAEVGQRINAILGSDVDGDVRTMLKKAEATIDALYVTIQDADAMIKDVRSVTGDAKVQENVRRTVAELPGTVAQTRQTLEAGQKTIEEARGVVANAATTVAALERNLRNLEGFTEPLGRHGAEIVNVVRMGTGQIGSVLDQVAVFTRSLNSPDGTVGKLLNDPALYQKVNLIADRIDGLLRDARPVLDDVRVITDKVARRGVGEVLRSAVRPDTLK